MKHSGFVCLLLLFFFQNIVVLCVQHADLEKYLIQPQGDYNPELPIDEQTGCLPYDPKWEFPKDRLRMGQCIYYSIIILTLLIHLFASSNTLYSPRSIFNAVICT
jgi:hypothetical protein